MSAQESAFHKGSDSSGFQLKSSEAFSSVCDRLRRLKRKKTPRYRLVNRYSKSPRQYWKERTRRKEAYELSSSGFTRQQIAEKLGVCAKTVSRDLKRTRRYHTGQFNKMIRHVRAERDAEYTKRYEHLPLREQRKHLLEDFKSISKMLQTRQRLRETTCVTVRVDENLRAARDGDAYGRPFVRLDTKSMTLPLRRFRLKIRFTAGDQLIGEATCGCGDFGDMKNRR